MGIIRARSFRGLKIVTSEFPELKESQNGYLDGGCLFGFSRTRYSREASKGVMWFWKMKPRIKSALFGAGKGVL